MKKKAHLDIHGKVTGVGYRYWTVRNAGELGLTGWVRNATSNQVEAVFEGEEENVKKMIKRCKKGPPSARVEKVKADWKEKEKEFEDFDIRY